MKQFGPNFKIGSEFVFGPNLVFDPNLSLVRIDVEPYYPPIELTHLGRVQTDISALCFFQKMTRT